MKNSNTKKVTEEKKRLESDLLFRLGEYKKYTKRTWYIVNNIIKLILEVNLSAEKRKEVITEEFMDDYNQNDWKLVLIGHEVSLLCKDNFKKELENILGTVEKYKDNMKDIDYLNICNSLISVNNHLIK